MYISRYHTTIYQQQNLPSWHEVEPEFSLTLATSQNGEIIIEEVFLRKIQDCKLIEKPERKLYYTV